MEASTVNKIKMLGLCVLLIGTALAWIPGQPARAEEQAQTQTLEEYFEVLRGDLTLRRDSALRALIQLGEGEAEPFWALQKAYDAELAQIGEKRLAVAQKYMKHHADLTAEQATGLAQKFLALDDERNALRRKYFEKIAADVSPIVAVQFLQLQRQFETMADLKVATNAPLAVRQD
jgi:hypothetical protein